MQAQTVSPTAEQTKAQEQINQFNMSMQTRQLDQNAVAARYSHEQIVISEIGGPLTVLLGLAMILLVIAHLVRRSIAAGITKNAQDNAASIEIAKYEQKES